MSTPLTVLGGYLGAGKTTLLNRLLKRSDLPPVGVLVNDFGAINIDVDLIRNRSGTTLQLANGCVCCSIAGDLGIALEDMRALQMGQVIIEASGVAQMVGDRWSLEPDSRESQTPGCRLVMIAPSGRVDLDDVRARLLSRAACRSQ